MDLSDALFLDAPYRWLGELADSRFKVLKFSVNHSLIDAGYNVERWSDSLLHELACVPASLAQFTVDLNGSYVLRVPGFDHSIYGHQMLMYRNLALLPDNSMGSGHRLREMDDDSTSSYWKP
jgi:hypothetical protein